MSLVARATSFTSSGTQNGRRMGGQMDGQTVWADKKGTKKTRKHEESISHKFIYFGLREIQTSPLTFPAA